MNPVEKLALAYVERIKKYIGTQTNFSSEQLLRRVGQAFVDGGVTSLDELKKKLFPEGRN